MITAAVAAIPAGTAGRLRSWLSRRHSPVGEAAAVLALYGLYELARGLVVGDTAEAERNAHRVAALERALHLFFEPTLQHAVQALPDVTQLLGFAYLTLHLTVTAGVLLWTHQRRPVAFPFVRTTLLIASGLSLVGFLVYPTAPPRLAGLGITDTVSNGHVDLNHGLVSSLYNPYAAMPSMHVGYALIVAATIVRHGRRPLARILATLYAPFVLLAIVATGNHFFLDAAAGAITAALAASSARVLMRAPAQARLAPLPRQPLSSRSVVPCAAGR
jgi:membrane-associated phospholipid phosphatase